VLGLAGPIDVQWARSILNACSLEFFDWRLKRCPAVLLAGQVEQYPETGLETRRP